MRYTDSKIRLLDFERSASRVFDSNTAVVSDDGLLLGIRDKNVHYMINEDATVAAFVQQGDLWSYSPSSNKLTQIFSFRKEENGDFRDSRTDHDIKIIRVEEDGDVDFVLYGYMNRGNHEGYSGVCVYHYNNDQNVVEEKVFIPSTESYEFLNEDLGTLSYVSEDSKLFLLFAQKLYQVDIEGGTYQILDEGISSENFVVSDTNAHAAWLVTEGDDAGTIKEIEFDTLLTRNLEASDGQLLRTVGFMNEDLVYGLIMDGDILTDQNGHVTEGIHTLRIEDFSGDLKKEYHQEGLYITDITVGLTLMEFELSAKSEKGYTVRKSDNIMNNKKATANQVTVEIFTNSRTCTQVRLAFEEEPVSETPLLMYAKMKSTEEHIISLDTRISQEDVYYVYARGSLDGIYTDVAEAVKRADERTGVVLNRAQQYIWERGNKKTKVQLNVEDIPDVMKTGGWDVQAIQEGIGESGTVIDLSGCSLDSVLYEISAQRPVIAKTGDDTCVVIVGYDSYNTYLYDPATGETSPYGMNDSTELFENAGNIFISYVEAVNY
jgi:hypothetical protein